MKKIGICSDHGGKDLKLLLLEYLKVTDYEIVDYGIDPDTTASVDYPDYAELLATDLSAGKIDCGIAICGTGIGMCITANRFSGVRAALVADEYSAKMSRLHNNANVLCMGARTTNHHRAVDWAKVWLETEYEGGRHDQRLQKIEAIERKQLEMR